MPQHILRLQLTAQEQQDLERLRRARVSLARQGSKRAVRELSRLEVIETVAKAGGNLLYSDITGQLGVSRAAAARALHDYREGQWNGLFGYWETNKNPLTRPSVRTEMLEGMRRGRWQSEAEVAAWLQKEHKVKVSPKRIDHLMCEIENGACRVWVAS